MAAILVLAAVVFKSPFPGNDASTAHVAVRAAFKDGGAAGTVLPGNRSQEAVALGTHDQANTGAVNSPAPTDQRGVNGAMTSASGLDSPLVPAGAELASPAERAAVSLRDWRTTGQLGYAVAALEAAKYASLADPQLQEARYNLASALEATSISLRDDARKLWEAYLAVDSTSDRAREVKHYLDEQDKSGKSPEQVSLHPLPSTIHR
jgi:hypothetical protein